MKGRKCSVIFVRKVANRLQVLEERYKNLSPKQRAGKINEELMLTFCVGKSEIIRWKQIVNLAKSHARNIADESVLQPSHYLEIAKLPEEKQSDIIEKVANEKLTYQQTALLVQQTLGKSDFKPQLFNVWNFNGCHEKYGTEGYPGRIPGQIVENLLYYYTNENDLIVDPMAGSGTTIDVCKAMNRKCLAYDLNPFREDIIQNDIQKGYPPETQNCDLIFLDPPYNNAMLKDLPFFQNLEEFYSFIRLIAQHSFRTVKLGGYVALLMLSRDNKGGDVLSLKTGKIFLNVGFDCFNAISVPLTTESANQHEVEWAKKNKQMLGRNRDLYVFKRTN